MLRLILLTAVAGAGLGCGGDSDEPGPFDQVPLDETLKAEGLTAPVHIVRDEFGVSHIHARDIGDLGFANGYVLASDRIQQMDLFRHVASGRLSRHLGSLELDVIDDDLEILMHRLLHFAELSYQELKQSSDPGDQELALFFDRYADGVNLFVEELREGKRLLDPSVSVWFDPNRFEPWTAVDSLAIGRFQAWSLSFDDRELDFTERFEEAIEIFDNADPDAQPARAARAGIFHDLFGLEPIDTTSTIDGFPNVDVDTGTRAREIPGVYARRPRVPPDVLAAARRALAPKQLLGRPLRSVLYGSNNWVIAPDLAGGSTLMANDPHLSLSSPALFHLVHLILDNPEQGSFDVTGISFPGIPGVILGHNEFIAWGGTVNNHDVTDYYLEEIIPCTAGGGDCVLFNGEEVAIETVTETIEIGALGTITDTKTVTMEFVPHHGPILFDIIDHDPVPRTSSQAISVRYTGYEISHDLRTFRDLWRATDVEEAMQAFDSFTFGGQNWVIADNQGNIGWTTQTKVPWRSPDCYSWHPDNAPDGIAPFMVMPSDGTCEWEGFMDDRYIPHALNPAKGYLATANADPVGATFDGDPLNGPVVDGRPLYVGATEYANGVRVGTITQRLEALVESGAPMTADDMASIQADAFSRWGEMFTPSIVAAVAELEEEVATPGTHADLQAFVAGLSSQQIARITAAAERFDEWSFDTPAAVRGNPGAAEIADSSATSLFNHWMSFFLPGAFGDELALFEEGVGSNAARAAYLVITRPGDLRTGLSPATGEPLLCDDLTTSGVVESCTLIILTSLHSALGRLAGAEGFDTEEMDAWRWGELHRLTCEALVPADELNLSPPGDPDSTLKGGYPRHGGLDAVDASNPGFGGFDYTFGSGPAMRHITEFPAGGAPITRMALPGGQSSDRASPHFRDLMDQYWANNEYFYLPFATQEILDSGRSRIKLKPD